MPSKLPVSDVTISLVSAVLRSMQSQTENLQAVNESVQKMLTLQKRGRKIVPTKDDDGEILYVDDLPGDEE